MVSHARGAASEGGRAGRGLALPTGAQGGPVRGPPAPQSQSSGMCIDAGKGTLMGGSVGRSVSPRPDY